MCEKRLGFDVLLARNTYSASKTGSPPEGETAFLLELYCRGSVSMTVKWVLGGMRTEPAELARFMVDSLPAPLRELFLRLGLL